MNATKAHAPNKIEESSDAVLDALQEQLGHRDINTTRIYLRLSDEDIKREVARIQF